MPRERQKKYTDGLTKQQRYVMRNREKVYEANARRKKERREQQKAAATHVDPNPVAESQIVPSTVRNNATSVPSTVSNDATSTVSSANSTEDTTALFEEATDFFAKWSRGLDNAIMRVDRCWSMQHGWTNATPLAGSKTERSLKRRADTARPLQSKLCEVLRRLPAGSENWESALELLQWVSFKTGQIFRILDHNYPETKTSEVEGEAEGDTAIST